MYMKSPRENAGFFISKNKCWVETPIKKVKEKTNLNVKVDLPNSGDATPLQVIHQLFFKSDHAFHRRLFDKLNVHAQSRGNLCFRVNIV